MGWFPQRGEIVADRFGTRFVLGDEIARGSQGIVFATQAEGAAVKISTGHDSADRRRAIEGQIREVARLPIADLAVALPRHTLAEPVVGYTMTLLTGMTSAQSLIRRSTAGRVVPWYIETGALRKRLAIVETLAEIIASLHARGLVYGDLSGSNVLVSAQPQRDRVFLIDLDNLRSADLIPEVIYTPPYAAPEQHTAGASQATDRFSLAVVASSLLAATNPFYGTQLDQLPPEDLERTPWSASAPWIDDPDDDSNRWTKGIDRTVVFSPRMTMLFRRAFCEGRHQSHERPAASLFATAARSAQLALSRCASCGWDNFVDSRSCANCSMPTAIRGFSLHEELPTTTTRFQWCPFALLDDRGEVSISSRALGMPGESGRRAVSIRSGKTGFEIKLEDEQLSFADAPIKRDIRVLESEPIRLLRDRRTAIVLAPLAAPK